MQVIQQLLDRLSQHRNLELWFEFGPRCQNEDAFTDSRMWNRQRIISPLLLPQGQDVDVDDSRSPSFDAFPAQRAFDRLTSCQ